jgi:hypothetical protein
MMNWTPVNRVAGMMKNRGKKRKKNENSDWKNQSQEVEISTLLWKKISSADSK